MRNKRDEFNKFLFNCKKANELKAKISKCVQHLLKVENKLDEVSESLNSIYDIGNENFSVRLDNIVNHAKLELELEKHKTEKELAALNYQLACTNIDLDEFELKALLDK